MRKSSTRKGFLFIALLVICSWSVSAQYIEEYSISAANGNKMLEIKNYQESVRQFAALVKEEPDKLEYKFKLATAYTYSTIDQQQGLSLLKELLKDKQDLEGFDEVYADALHRNYYFDESEAIFRQLLESATEEDKKQKYQQKLAQLKVAKELVKHPLHVSFENLGDDVNSEAPDFLPLTPPDESIVVFTTRRRGVVGNLYDFGGYRTADIFIAKNKRNGYSRARSIGSPNTYGNEHTAGRSENGDYLLYTVDSDDFFDDLFVSEKGRRSYMPPKVFDSKAVNQKTSESGATLSNDGLKMYFSSNRDGGFGGYDIYWVQRLPNGEWGEPKNLGGVINTPGDEMYPYLAEEGTALYFSSNGHNTMGGLDLFLAQKKAEGDWQQPQNIGYPINTPNDDMNISFAANKRYAYVASKREDSFGDLDIYRVTFLDEQDDYTLLTGKVLASDSSSVFAKTVTIEIYSLDNDVLYGTYLSKAETGKYMAILPTGRYILRVESAEGYRAYERKITLLGKNDFQESREMDIVMKEE
jgi:hypothetical protein